MSKTKTGEDNDILERLSLTCEEASVEIQEKTFREKLCLILKTNVVQYGIIFLVVLDSIIVILELLIDMDIIVLPDDDGHSLQADHHGSNSSHSSQENTTYPEPHKKSIHHRRLLFFEVTTTPDINYTDFNNHTSGHATHGGHHGHSTKEKAEHILHYASLTILSIFVVEVITKIYAERTHLLKHKAEVFDSIVVIVSFTMDIVFSFINVADAARDAAGLMVILRMWRITRIINGVIMSVKLDADKKIQEQKHARAKAEAEVEKLKEQVQELENELEELREQLRVLENDDKMNPIQSESCET